MQAKDHSVDVQGEVAEADQSQGPAAGDQEGACHEGSREHGEGPEPGLEISDWVVHIKVNYKTRVNYF